MDDDDNERHHVSYQISTIHTMSTRLNIAVMEMNGRKKDWP